MDFIVSYQLYNKIKKKELNDLNNKKNDSEKEKEKDNLISKTCERCGQDPYFCQCSNNTKRMYHNFNPEKDKY